MASKALTEDEIALYDAIERAIANVRAALAEIDRAWARVNIERPSLTARALAAMDTADKMLAVAREDLARARTAPTVYTRHKLAQ